MAAKGNCIISESPIAQRISLSTNVEVDVEVDVEVENEFNNKFGSLL